MRKFSNDMNDNKRTLYDISAEITGIGRLILALSLPLDDKDASHLLEQPLQEALFAIEAHLDRIAEDLEQLDE